jgi:hypothetical protein
MDDLRGWTLGGAIQNKIHVYLASETMETVATTFPFLVDSSKATGTLLCVKIEQRCLLYLYIYFYKVVVKWLISHIMYSIPRHHLKLKG